MNRRAVLLGATGVAAAVAVGGALYVAMPDDDGALLFDKEAPKSARRDAFVEALVASFTGVPLPVEVARRFVEAHTRIYGFPGTPRALERVQWRVLMSTDFFPRGQTVDTPLAFVAYYDPWSNPCYNPLRTD